MEPNKQQHAALREWAHVHGRTWKAALRDAWMTGNYRGIDPYGDNAAYLQQLRNNFGPSWLVNFHLTEGGGWICINPR